MTYHMKKIITSAIAIFACVAVSATEPWSLDSCVAYAIEHNIDVRSRSLQKYSGELDVTEAKDAFLPRVSGYASESFNFGRGLTADNTYANRNTQSFSAGASLQLPLFQGLTAIRRLSYAKAGLRVMVEQLESAKDDVTLNVISQYLQALYTQEMLAVAREQLEISRSELKRQEALLELGKIPELNLYEAKSQVAQDELSVVSATNDSIIALLDLSQLLNLPSDSDFHIRPLEEQNLPLLSADEVYSNALENNHAMRAARLSVESADKYISVAKAGYNPTLSFNAGIGSNYYKTTGFNNESFGSQMRHNFAQSIGFSLSVPLFDAFSTRNAVRKAKVQHLSAQLQLDDARNRLYKAINQAYTQAVGAEKKKEAATVAVTSSKAAFEAMQEKYNYGRANATEFDKAKATYTTALSQAVQAKYEAILRIRILEFYNKNN